MSNVTRLRHALPMSPDINKAVTMIGAKGEVTVFGLGPKCDDLQCLGAMRLGEQKLIDVLLDLE